MSASTWYIVLYIAYVPTYLHMYNVCGEVYSLSMKDPIARLTKVFSFNPPPSPSFYQPFRRGKKVGTGTYLRQKLVFHLSLTSKGHMRPVGGVFTGTMVNRTY